MLLVTGGSGHIGGRLLARLAAEGRPVLATHRGRMPDNAPDGVAWAACDLTDRDAVIALARDHGVTSCIHGAAVSNEAYARPDPLGAVHGNIGATATLLDAARDLGWRRFLLVGTGSVFQSRRIDGQPIPEDAPPEPANVYATTKTAAEMLTRMYRTEFGLPASSVRISWVYGPPIVADDAKRGPIPSFLLRTLKGEAIREGGGGFAASFTFVEDVVDGLLAGEAAETLDHDVYHLGHGRNFSLAEVADAIRAHVPDAVIELGAGTDPWTRFTALRDPLGIGRLEADTGFRCRWSLDAGIGAYADWLRNSKARWEERR
jgi:nucleoside-diphosphate-sugar epimerase